MHGMLSCYNNCIIIGGAVGSNDSIENRVSLMSIREQSLGQGEKADYVTVKGVVNFIKHDNDCWYTACPHPGCNKKVIEGIIILIDVVYMGRWID